MTAYLSCPQWDGNPPDIVTPEEQIEHHRRYLEHQATHGWTRQTYELAALASWSPQHCKFYRLDANGDLIIGNDGNPIIERTTPEWDVVRNRERIRATHRCTVHNIEPEVWARQDAFHRRHQAQLNTTWEQRPVQLEINGRQMRRFIWYRRRNAPATLHSIWPAFRRRRNATRA